MVGHDLLGMMLVLCMVSASSCRLYFLGRM